MSKDTIYRQAAIEIASGYCHPANIADELRKLPSAQPERKKGEWRIIDEYMIKIYKCSQCNNASLGGNYCPNCGADMRR